VEPVLTMEEVSFRYRDSWVIRGLSLSANQGEILGVLGPNASGKTTLVRLMDGIVFPQKGRVRLQGKEMRSLGRREIARRVAVVPQETPMLYAFSALEVVLMGRSPHLRLLGFEDARDLEIARRSLDKTGCSSLWDRNVNELSGGERQRVLIARALAQEPRILLLDEPTAYLDLRHQLDFLDLLLQLHREEGMTIVWVSHDLNLASWSCQRVLLLKVGRIFAIGCPQDVLTEEKIEAVYGRRVLVDRNPQVGAPRITPVVGQAGIQA
jgi:iron complex transport system ATP-binding protein